MDNLNPWKLSQGEINTLFLALDRHLKSQPLPQESDKPRIASADEFMLMTMQRSGRIDFKHRDTRNYVYLVPAPKDDVLGRFGVLNDGWRLEVPFTSEPFKRGYFDKFQ
jgi:hypothetical protein